MWGRLQREIGIKGIEIGKELKGFGINLILPSQISGGEFEWQFYGLWNLWNRRTGCRTAQRRGQLNVAESDNSKSNE